MAPVDRREHRQQRVRGAGPSSVQASFGFNFGALGARPAKQASLPPQLSSRRTPSRGTPRGPNGSAKRFRSASLQRSSGSKTKSTPRANAVTPQLGKRKRGSPYAQEGPEDGEEDELSPDREEIVRSIEKSRRVVGTVSPIREASDDAPDELSVLEGANTGPRSVLDVSTVTIKTPISVLAQKRTSSGRVMQETPNADSTVHTSHRSVSRRPDSRDRGPTTPGLLLNGQAKVPSASRSGLAFETPSAANQDESEDELSPQLSGATPRVVARERQSLPATQAKADVDVDELSSPIQSTSVQQTPASTKATIKAKATSEQPAELGSAPQATKRRAPGHTVGEKGEDLAEAPAKRVQRGRPRKQMVDREVVSEATPVARKPRRATDREAVVDEQVDELSPGQTLQQTGRLGRRADVLEISSAEEESDEYEEPEAEKEPTPRPAKKQHSPKEAQRIKPSTEKPARKRPKFLGPKHAISVMRIKGSAVRGITVADTTRTILEETIDHRLNRMAEKLQTSQASDRRKELRSEINLSLSFKESLNEKLLDLQDANDVLSTNFKKMKLFKRHNADLRKEILSLQNHRHEIALEQDDVQAEFDADKAEMEGKNTLSDDMFEIEAAMEIGRERARLEGREEEGPEIPLSMLVEAVAEDVGPSGGGLLCRIRGFNGLLDRAAGWLEGRA